MHEYERRDARLAYSVRTVSATPSEKVALRQVLEISWLKQEMTVVGIRINSGQSAFTDSIRQHVRPRPFSSVGDGAGMCRKMCSSFDCLTYFLIAPKGDMRKHQHQKI